MLFPQFRVQLTDQARYKTKLCRSYDETGWCRFGDQCKYAHEQEELQP